jgi:hypothetical protein
VPDRIVEGPAGLRIRFPESLELRLAEGFVVEGPLVVPIGEVVAHVFIVPETFIKFVGYLQMVADDMRSG